MGISASEYQLSIEYLEEIPNTRPLSNYRAIPIDRFRYRGRSDFKEYAFAYCIYGGSDHERCELAPLNQAQTSDELAAKLVAGCPGLVVLRKGLLNSHFMRIDKTPALSSIEELVVRSFAARQSRDYGDFRHARMRLGDSVLGDGYTISELLRLYGRLIPVCQ